VALLGLGSLEAGFCCLGIRRPPEREVRNRDGGSGGDGGGWWDGGGVDGLSDEVFPRTVVVVAPTYTASMGMAWLGLALNLYSPSSCT
jgi:hypothetical protein